jgi:hypothetical protein
LRFESSTLMEISPGLGVRVFLRLRVKHLDGDKPEPVCEQLVAKHPIVIRDKDLFNGHGRDLGQQNTSQGVANGHVDTTHVEYQLILTDLEHFDLEPGPPRVQAEFLVLVGVCKFRV